jgi:hypothetical protein
METHTHPHTSQLIIKENTSASAASMADAFLQRKADGYRVLFLGKNGEP